MTTDQSVKMGELTDAALAGTAVLDGPCDEVYGVNLFPMADGSRDWAALVVVGRDGDEFTYRTRLRPDGTITETERLEEV